MQTRIMHTPIVRRYEGLICGVLGLILAGCPGTFPPPTDTFSSDATLSALNVAAGRVAKVANNAVLSVTGDTRIDGTLEADSGRITIRASGNVTINGTIRAADPDAVSGSENTPLGDQSVGILLVVGDGEVTFGSQATLASTGPVVVTDDEALLDSTPAELFDQVEDVLADDLPTLTPLPPDHPAFTNDGSGSKRVVAPQQQGVPAAPVTVSGTWPPPGSPPIAGDTPVVIFRFNGARPLNLEDWTVNGPPAPDGDDDDQSADPGTSATGSPGKNGMRLNIFNNGGPINVVGTVVLNLADGGDGGDATTACSDATGGPGGRSGNFRMTAAGGIDLTRGTLTINPGRAGDGGDGFATGQPPTAGCPGLDGMSATATGGKGADEQKRLFARGNVSGLENVTIGPLTAGDGGDAVSGFCDGGEGLPCCDGGAGGNATAVGGGGGNASLNISGLPVATSMVVGGNGGSADALGGDGGDGGDCKFDDAGDGGDGGSATATGGNGGSASNTGAGGATGGNGGGATAEGGDGGDGGDSAFGAPGAGGAGGTGTATTGAGGAGATAGVDGTDEATDGTDGAAGAPLGVTLFCLPLSNFVQPTTGVIQPGPRDGPVFAEDLETVLGSITIDFVELPEADYQRGEFPVPHVGIINGVLRIDADSLVVETEPPGEIGGIRLVPLSADNVSEQSQIMVRALSAEGEFIGERAFSEIPNNSDRPEEPETLDATFSSDVPIVAFELIVPADVFLTIIRVYLLDP